MKLHLAEQRGEKTKKKKTKAKMSDTSRNEAKQKRKKKTQNTPLKQQANKKHTKSERIYICTPNSSGLRHTNTVSLLCHKLALAINWYLL